MKTNPLILFPVDFSKRCIDASWHVMEWTKRFSGRLTVLNVVDPKDFSASPERDYDRFTEAVDTYIAKAKRDLDYFCRTHLPGIIVQKSVVEGDTAECIAEAAEFEKVDLITLPRDHQGVASRWLHDSVTSTVLEKASASVWTTEYPADIRSIKRILCPLHVACSLSQDAENEKVLSMLRDVATTLAAEVIILCVQKSWQADTIQRIRYIEESMRNIATVEVTYGNVGDRIKEVANRAQADLIVLGRTAPDTSGLTRQAHILAVNHRTFCPVLSVF